MKIGISGMFWTQPGVGSGQYLHQLVRHLPAAGPQHSYLLFIPAYPRAERPALPGVEIDVIPTPFDRKSRQLAKLWYEQVELPRAARRLGVDLLHVPYLAPPLRRTVPVVCTIHDLIPLLLPEYRGSLFFRGYTTLVTSAARRVIACIADSDHTRDDVVRHLHLPAQRVHTVYLAPAPIYRPVEDRREIEAVLREHRLREPYIYYVGGLDARKNLGTLLRAFGRVRRRFNRPVQLAIAGRPIKKPSALFPSLEPIILDEGIAADVAFLGYVSEEHNRALYSGCAAFVYPSRYEGFGLPPLEAMACGAPVVCSNATSLPEAVGSAAILVDPHDVEGWAQGMLRFLEDEEQREEYRGRGLRRAARFTWPQVAANTLAVYERAFEASLSTVNYGA